MNLSKSKNTTKKELKKDSIKEKEERLNLLLLQSVFSGHEHPDIEKLKKEIDFFYYGIK